MTLKHLLLAPPACGRDSTRRFHGAHSRFIRLFSPRTDHAARYEITTVPPVTRLTIAIPPDEAAPSLQPHYRALLTTTSDSAPVLRLGTRACRGCLLDRLPLHRSDRFSRSAWKPGSRSRHLHAGRRLGHHRAPPNLVPGEGPAPGFDVARKCFDTSSVVRSRSSP